MGKTITGQNKITMLFNKITVIPFRQDAFSKESETCREIKQF